MIMKKKILLGFLFAIACIVATGCSCKSENKKQEVKSADYDGVVQDFTAGVDHITALHRQTMFTIYKGEQYAWYEPRVLFNDSIKWDTIGDLKVVDVTNIFQLFYTFGLGLVLGYLYVRTGKLRLPIIFHVAINALGGLIPTLLLRLVESNAGMSIEKLLALPTERMTEFLGAIIPYSIFSLLIFAAAAAGLVLFFMFLKKLRFEPAKDELPKGRAFKTVCLNAGFIIYFIVCVGLMVMNLLEGAGLIGI